MVDLLSYSDVCLRAKHQVISKLIGRQDPGEPFTRAMEVGVVWVGWDLNVPLLVTCTAEYKGLSKKGCLNKVTRTVDVVLQRFVCLFAFSNTQARRVGVSEL